MLELEAHDRAVLLSEVWHTIQEQGYTLLGYSHGQREIWTVGTWHSFGVPDVVVSGLDAPVGRAVLHAYVSTCRDGRLTVPNRTFHGGVLGRYLQLHKVTSPWQEAFHPWELFGGEVAPWRQLVWSDKAGRWPWARYADFDCRSVQQCFTEHGYAWGTSRPAYEPRRWDRDYPTSIEYLAHQTQIQGVLVRGGWRTPEQAARTLADYQAHYDSLVTVAQQRGGNA